MALQEYQVNTATVLCLEQKRADYMGNPQVDDGHTRIANELLEAIMSFRFSGPQCSVLFAVVRRTYGFNKKSDKLAQSVISEMTGIAKPNVCKVIKQLKAMNVLRIDDSGFSHSIELNKRYKEWKNSYPVDNRYPVDSYPADNEIVIQQITKPLSTRQPQKKERKKDTQNVVLPDWLDAEIWSAFVAMRKSKKRPLTNYAAQLVIKKLDVFRQQGHSVSDILHASIENCWQGVFAPKSSQSISDPFAGAI